MDSIGELPLSSLRTPRSMAHFSLATNATQIDDDDDDDVGRPGTIPEENGGFPWEKSSRNIFFLSIAMEKLGGNLRGKF